MFCLVLAALGLGDAARPALGLREECTIGVASPGATSDGRALLWKTRDTDSHDNEVYYNRAFPQRFVAVVNADGGPESLAWMGVNEHGFAVLNSNVSDLRSDPSLPGNGAFLRDALGQCRSVAMLQDLLVASNGQRETHGCFGAIDSTGAAFMFEVSPDSFWTYDAAAAPGGFLVRTNFACKDTIDDGPPSGSGGIERFRRSMAIVTELAAEDRLDARGLIEQQLRDFSGRNGAPIPVPCYQCGGDSMPGFIDTRYSICGDGSASASLVQGVRPGEEPAYLSTFWTLLGNPALTVTLPFWPVGDAPPAADGPGSAPLCDRARALHRILFRQPSDPNLADSFFLLDGAGGGLWTETLPLEALILDGSNVLLEQWRQAPPGWDRMLAAQDSLAAVALEALLGLTAVSKTEAGTGAGFAHLSPLQPNPFSGSTAIRFELCEPAALRLTVYDPRGRKVTQLLSARRSSGQHRVDWDARGLPSGVYLIRLETEGETHTCKGFLLR
jgi:hypothetical protein